MRHILSTATSAALACLLASACSSDIDNIVPGTEGNGKHTITATTEQPSDLRTSLSESLSVLWNDGDAISLLSSGSNDKFVLSAGAGTGSAAFTGEITGGEPFYALYPYSKDARIEDGCIKFSIPQVQTVSSDSPAEGTLYSFAVQGKEKQYAFKNLCGILELNLKGTATIKTIKVQDLSGKNIWGECSLVLDGKEGTDEQTMSISGGSNSISVEFKTLLALSASQAKSVDIALPAGSLKNGFSIALYDNSGKAVSFLTAQKPFSGVGRSIVVPMAEATLPDNGENTDVRGRGYYKDVFMDGSVYLSGYTNLPACPYIGFSLEYIASSSYSNPTGADTITMRNVFAGDDTDPNGALLYPDGEPRFRLVYVNGGSARSHGNALGSAGRENFRKFVSNGGSYVGSCAGAYLACTGTHSGTYEEYYGIYPGICTNCDLQNTYTGQFVEPGSPLLKYYTFGGDKYVSKVYHNGGCYISDADLIPGAEILMRYDYKDKPMHKQGSVWAYKASNTTGRVIPSGSHPERETSGERRDMMAAMLLYAADGNGDPTVKTKIIKGKLYDMSNNKSLSKAGLGDGQYHHYTLEIPEGAKNIKVDLSSTFKDYDLYLTLRKGDFAWRSDADFVFAQSGSDKSITIDSLEPGTWYLGICCATKPTATVASNSGCMYFKYIGKNAAVSGVTYKFKVTWE